MKITHSTISSNATGTDGNGGSIYVEAGVVVSINDTILANGASGGPGVDCSGLLASQGFNLIEVAAGCAVFEAANSGTDITAADPLLAPLADNGGRTRTHALRPGSPAIDTGDCSDIGGAPVATDQRGVSRPQGSTCDIGAYERVSTYLPLVMRLS